MDRRSLIRLLGAGVAAAAVPGAAAAEPAREGRMTRILRDIARARASVKTLVAPFTQERRLALFATTIVSEGEMTLVRPDRLRWELRPPDAITYWISPEGVAYRSASGRGGTGASSAGRFGALFTDLLTLLGGDLARLERRYELDVLAEGELLELSARPRFEAGLTRLELALGPGLWELRRLRLHERGDDRSEIRFGEVIRDLSIDPARLRPPP